MCRCRDSKGRFIASKVSKNSRKQKTPLINSRKPAHTNSTNYCAGESTTKALNLKVQ